MSRPAYSSVAFLALVAGAFSACGGDDGGTNGTGAVGATSGGGVSVGNTGGSVTTGQGGAVSGDMKTGQGGAAPNLPSSGGSVVNPENSGGSQSAGGTPSSGGAPGAGGAPTDVPSAGGQLNNGGVPSAGGTPNTGGMPASPSKPPPTNCDTGELVAFPCAEGYGKVATGGRGGDVYIVTTLNATGPGSLGAALSASGPRTVVFQVAGTIKGTFNISNDDITIAGQSAPGDGIAINGHLEVEANNVIIRYLRVRGDGTEDSITNDHNNPNHTQIYDHLSTNWSADEVMSIYFNSKVTIQYTIVTEAGSASHKYGAIWGNDHSTYHHNLFAHNSQRNPRIASGSGYNDFRNNVIYNWYNNAIHGGEMHEVKEDKEHVFQSINVVANYMKPGPGTKNPKRLVSPWAREVASDFGHWYIAENFLHGDPEITADNHKGISSQVKKWVGPNEPELVPLTAPSEFEPIAQQTAEEAFETVLAHAGCAKPTRDALDARLVKEVRTGTAVNGDGFVSGPGTLPTLKAGQAPTDADKDGMADDWEMKNGLSPSDPSDRNKTDGIGYTMLENYLNSLDDF